MLTSSTIVLTSSIMVLTNSIIYAQIRQLQSMVERATPAQTRLEEQLASAQQLVRLYPPNSRFSDLEFALADPINPRLCPSIRLICTRG